MSLKKFKIESNKKFMIKEIETSGEQLELLYNNESFFLDYSDGYFKEVSIAEKEFPIETITGESFLVKIISDKLIILVNKDTELFNIFSPEEFEEYLYENPFQVETKGFWEQTSLRETYIERYIEISCMEALEETFSSEFV